MSAYIVMKCDFIADTDTLCNALTKLGLKYEQHPEPVSLIGWEGDARDLKAEIVVRKKEINSKFTGFSNDIGFRWSAANNRYDIICSDYDTQNKMDERVKQAYAATAVEQAMKRKDFRIESQFCGQRTLGDVVTIGVKVI